MLDLSKLDHVYKLFGTAVWMCTVAMPLESMHDWVSPYRIAIPDT